MLGVCVSTWLRKYECGVTNVYFTKIRTVRIVDVHCPETVWRNACSFSCRAVSHDALPAGIHQKPPVVSDTPVCDAETSIGPKLSHSLKTPS
jgi:hypothetical protein